MELPFFRLWFEAHGRTAGGRVALTGGRFVPFVREPTRLSSGLGGRIGPFGRGLKRAPSLTRPALRVRTGHPGRGATHRSGFREPFACRTAGSPARFFSLVAARCPTMGGMVERHVQWAEESPEPARRAPASGFTMCRPLESTSGTTRRKNQNSYLVRKWGLGTCEIKHRCPWT